MPKTTKFLLLMVAVSLPILAIAGATRTAKDAVDDNVEVLESYSATATKESGACPHCVGDVLGSKPAAAFDTVLDTMQACLDASYCGTDSDEWDEIDVAWSKYSDTLADDACGDVHAECVSDCPLGGAPLPALDCMSNCFVDHLGCVDDEPASDTPPTEPGRIPDVIVVDDHND